MKSSHEQQDEVGQAASLLDTPPQLTQTFPENTSAPTTHRRVRFDLHESSDYNDETNTSLPTSPVVDFSSRLDAIILDALRWVNTTGRSADAESLMGGGAATPASRILPSTPQRTTPVRGEGPTDAAHPSSKRSTQASEEVVDAVELLRHHLHTPEQQQQQQQQKAGSSSVHTQNNETAEEDENVVTIQRVDAQQQQQHRDNGNGSGALASSTGLVSTVRRSPAIHITAVSPPLRESTRSRSSERRTGPQSALAPAASTHQQWQQGFADYAAQMLRETRKQVEVLRDYQHRAQRETRRADQLGDALRVAQNTLAAAEQTRAATEQRHSATVAALSQEVLQLEETVGALRRAQVDLQSELAAARRSLKAEREARQAAPPQERVQQLEAELSAMRHQLHQREEAWQAERAMLLTQRAQGVSSAVSVAERRRDGDLPPQKALSSPLQVASVIAPSRSDAATETEPIDASPSTSNDAHEAARDSADASQQGGYLRVHPDIVAQQQLREHTLLSQLTLLEAQLQREIGQRRLAEQRVVDLMGQNEDLHDAAVAAAAVVDGRSSAAAQTSAGTSQQAQQAEQRQEEVLREVQLEYEALQKDSEALLARYTIHQRQSREQWFAVTAQLRSLLDLVDVQLPFTDNGATAQQSESSTESLAANVIRALKAVHEQLTEQRHASASASAQEREAVRLATLQQALQQADAQDTAHRAALDVAERQLQDARTELSRWQQQQEDLEQRQQEEKKAWQTAATHVAQMSEAVQRALRVHTRGASSPLPRRVVSTPAQLRRAEQLKNRKKVGKVTTRSVGAVISSTDALKGEQHSSDSAAGPACAFVGGKGQESGGHVEADQLERDAVDLKNAFQALLTAWRGRQRTYAAHQTRWRAKMKEAALSAAAVEARCSVLQRKLRERTQQLHDLEQQHVHDLAELQQDWTRVREEQRVRSAQERQAAQAEAAHECDVLLRRALRAEERAETAEEAALAAKADCEALHTVVSELRDAQEDAAQAEEQYRRQQSDLHIHIEALEERLQVARQTETALHALLTAATRAAVGLLLKLHHLRVTYGVAQALQLEANSLLGAVQWALAATVGAEAAGAAGAATTSAEPAAALTVDGFPAPLTTPSHRRASCASRLRVAVHAVLALTRLQRLAQLRREAANTWSASATTSSTALHQPRYASLSTVLATCGIYSLGLVANSSGSGGASAASLAAESMLPELRLPPAHELVTLTSSNLENVALPSPRAVHFSDGNNGCSTEEPVSPAGKQTRSRSTNITTASTRATTSLLELLFSVGQLDLQAPTTHFLFSAACSSLSNAGAVFSQRVRHEARQRHTALQRAKAVLSKSDAADLHLSSFLPPVFSGPLHLLRAASSHQVRQLRDMKAVVQQLLAQNKRLVSAVETQAQHDETRSLEMNSLSAQLALQLPRGDEVVALRTRLVQSGEALLAERKLRRTAEAQLAELRHMQLQWAGEEQELRREVYALNMELANTSSTATEATQPSVLSIRQNTSTRSREAAVTGSSHTPPSRAEPLPPTTNTTVVDRSNRGNGGGAEDYAYYHHLLRSSGGAAATAELQYAQRHNIPTAAEVLTTPPPLLRAGPQRKLSELSGSGSGGGMAALQLFEPRVVQHQLQQQQEDRRNNERHAASLSGQAATVPSPPVSHIRVTIAPAEMKLDRTHGSPSAREPSTLCTPPLQQQHHPVFKAHRPTPLSELGHDAGGRRTMPSTQQSTSPSPPLQAHTLERQRHLALAEAWAPPVPAQQQQQTGRAVVDSSPDAAAAAVDPVERSATLPPPPPQQTQSTCSDGAAADERRAWEERKGSRC